MQGFNMGRYIPPDLQGHLSFNQASGKRPTGRSLTSAPPTVRFEMPFPIWCTSCPKPTIIGQGVRFNAQKSRVGNYLSTPIYAFRMKHTICGGQIEIRTDPQNTAYVVTEGAKRRDHGEERDGLREGEMVIAGKTEEQKRRLEGDPFARLEEQVGSEKQASSAKMRIEELYKRNSRDWKDPAEVNRRLRRDFRAERKVRERDTANSEALRDPMGIGIELLEETEEDKRRAGYVEFGDWNEKDGASRPLFGKQESRPGTTKAGKTLKGAKAIEYHKETLRKALDSSTRAAIDPFTNSNSDDSTRLSQRLIKRKRRPSSPRDQIDSPKTALLVEAIAKDSVPLVDYGSD